MSKTKLTILNENKWVDTYMIYSFINRLVTPFTETDAFKLGIIDENGNVLKKTRTSSNEKAAYTLFDRLIFNLKKLIEKLPFGKRLLASYAAALFLLKENKFELNELDDNEFESQFFLFLEQANSCLQTQLTIGMLSEEIAANNVGQGEIAGTGHDGELPAKNAFPKKKDKKGKFKSFLLKRKEKKEKEEKL